MPFEFDPAEGTHGTLRAHVARANPVWQEVAEQPDALVIFQGPAAYISPNWYPSKHEAHRQVPTYNYMVVHAHGRIVVRDDEAFVRGLVARLTRKMEANEPRPWKMGDAPADYLTQMLGAIVGHRDRSNAAGRQMEAGAKQGSGAIAAAQRTRLLANGGDMQEAVAEAMLNAPPAF